LTLACSRKCGGGGVLGGTGVKRATPWLGNRTRKRCCMAVVFTNGQRQSRSRWFEHAHIHCRWWPPVGLAAMPLMMARARAYRQCRWWWSEPLLSGYAADDGKSTCLATVPLMLCALARAFLAAHCQSRLVARYLTLRTSDTV